MLRYLALGLVALGFAPSAHAQSVEVMVFGPSTSASVDDLRKSKSASRSSSPVDRALRFFLRTTADPRTTPAQHHLAYSSCASAPYVPAPWLSAKVERRRRMHYAAIAKAACESGILPSLLEALVAQESGYRTLATSRAGAKGLTQLMPGTADAMGVARPFEPMSNLRGGARYLRDQLVRFRRIDLALAAYNAGPERRALSEGRIPNISETKAYIRSVLNNWERIAKHARHGEILQRQTRMAGGPSTGRTAVLATFK
ncbi:lytic transglycosylase domain-containing protein [Novosphingobium sp. ES2-1]|uniref:lytic transglycosylase domain-containing protein n=1 Tax=Novosphingobium sp. ES2-1 TaxID=2780074 RepID=UPI00188292E0|nr:lytic transglycosylase domain-containing protein [Novosphingobium sp. ES2-1]QOV96154.1 transglycosylase SLT domain-containing protein [Novosphingobium sp. ES2-1]